MSGRAITHAFSFAICALSASCSRSPSGNGEAGVGPPAEIAPSTSASISTNATSEAPVSIATMKLLDPGKPPRRTLRYAWHLDRHETLTMDLRTSASTEEGGAKQPEFQLPPVHIELTISPKSVSPEGDLEYAWKVSSSSVSPLASSPSSSRSTDAEATPSSVMEGMRAEVAVVDHLSGTALVTPRGLAKRISIDPSSLADGSSTAQMVEQVRQTLRDIAAPFPEEEVGVGARWEKLSQLASRDTRVTQSETFTLVDLEGDRGSLDDVLTQTAPPQPLAGPAGSRSERARIESMLASGDGKTHFDLSRLVPATSFTGTTTMVLLGQSPEDDNRKITMIMHVGIVLGGTLR